MKSLKYCENYENVTQKHEVNKCCWKNGANRLTPNRIATDLRFVQNVVSANVDKVKCNTTRYAWTLCYHTSLQKH